MDDIQIIPYGHAGTSHLPVLRRLLWAGVLGILCVIIGQFIWTGSLRLLLHARMTACEHYIAPAGSWTLFVNDPRGPQESSFRVQSGFVGTYSVPAEWLRVDRSKTLEASNSNGFVAMNSEVAWRAYGAARPSDDELIFERGELIGNVFLHERASANGLKALVVVDLCVTGYAPNAHEISFVFRTFDSTGPFEVPRLKRMQRIRPRFIVSPDVRLSVGAGRVDASDGSMFHFIVQIDQWADIVNGQLRDDGSVKLSLRDTRLPSGGFLEFRHDGKASATADLLKTATRPANSERSFGGQHGGGL